MNLKQLRSLASMTQFELANGSGVERSRISLAENGHVELRTEEMASVTKTLLDSIQNRGAVIRCVLAGAARVSTAKDS